MTDETDSESSETPQSPIRPMASLEIANTPITPPAQTSGVITETPSSGGPLPSLTVATHFVTTDNHIPIPTMNNTISSLFPKIGGPNLFTPPPLPLFFPNTDGPSNTGYILIPPPIHSTKRATTNDNRNTTVTGVSH